MKSTLGAMYSGPDDYSIYICGIQVFSHVLATGLEISITDNVQCTLSKMVISLSRRVT